MNVKTLKLTARIVISGFFVSVGIHHFIDPTPYLIIMPPYLPAHLELVYMSGVFEMLGGLGLFIQRVRMFAGWGLIALLIAVYPANIHMLINEVYLPDMPKEKWLLWLRMPLQFVLGWLVYWANDLSTAARTGSTPSQDT